MDYAPILHLAETLGITKKRKMKITLTKGDITKIPVDAIVNSTNVFLLGGGGLDGAIHSAGGIEIMKECIEIRKRQIGCDMGEAVITTAGNLPAKKVIHTVGPFWHDEIKDKPEKLANCYLNSLKLAAKYGLKRISFPNISVGNFGYPKNEAAKIAITTVKNYEAKDIDEVIFVCYEDDNYLIYKGALGL